MYGIFHKRKLRNMLYSDMLIGYSVRVILASLHVCVPVGTSLEQWEKTEQILQHCFAEYGIRHVTISPEIHRDTLSTQPSEETIGGCRLPSHDDFGCAVSDLKKRKTGVA